MNNFPFYNQYTIKLNFPETVEIDERLVDRLSQILVKELNLYVVKTTEHVFDNGGLTKVYILSASHLIAHTWPEKHAIHLNLMTCREGLTRDLVENAVKLFGQVEKEIVELE